MKKEKREKQTDEEKELRKEKKLIKKRVMSNYKFKYVIHSTNYCLLNIVIGSRRKWANK